MKRAPGRLKALLRLGALRRDRLPPRLEPGQRGARLVETRRKRHGTEPSRARLVRERRVLVPQLLSPLLETRRRPGADRSGKEKRGQSDHRRGYERGSQPPTWQYHGGEPNTSQACFVGLVPERSVRRRRHFLARLRLSERSVKVPCS